VAESLSRRVGIDGKVSYQRGSASDLPFAPLTFDGAYRLHVGMNIADKKLLFAQIRRVLKTGAVFGIYDVMRESDGTLSFPLPWALYPDTSFVESVTTYRALLNATGFEVQKVRSRREFAIESSSRCACGPGKTTVAPRSASISRWDRPGGKRSITLPPTFERGLIAPAEIACRAT
jgi:SAM-dependent methyltransferase